MPRQIPAVVAATALAGSAMAQPPPPPHSGRFEATNCFGGTTTAIDRWQAYTVTALDFRGMVRAVGEKGGPLGGVIGPTRL
jgi:hypothetical protein